MTARRSPTESAPRPGDRPFFAENSLIRAVQRERVVAMSGGRALFMQAAHPVAFVGFFSHTGALGNPHPRLMRTALAVNTVIFGTERQAREVQTIVGAMHARVQGRTKETVGPFPAGTPFRGDDPDLLLWILAAFADSSYGAYERLVRPLSPAERDELWQQWRRVGEIFGLADDEMPATYAVFRHYVDGMVRSGRLVVTPRARALAREVILNPPIPAKLLPVKELINQWTIDSLPGDLKQQFGFVPVPGRGLAFDALSQWVRYIGRPLAPDVVRWVPPMVMPAPDRDYGDIAKAVQERMAS